MGVDTSVDEKQLIRGLHEFIDREVMPLQAALGETFENPRLYYQEDGREAKEITEARREARMASARAGYYTMFCPKEFGGADLGIRLWFLCWESIFHRYGAPTNQLPYFVLSHFTGGPHEVWQHASESLKGKIIPDLSAGKLQGCFGMSEPDAGSDAWMMRTAAVRDDGDWVINGSKQWTSWAPSADFVMVYAVTNKELAAERKRGITCFYVPTIAPGFRIESIIKLFGQLGGNEAVLSFTDVRVPDEYRVGEVDKGFALAMLGVSMDVWRTRAALWDLHGGRWRKRSNMQKCAARSVRRLQNIRRFRTTWQSPQSICTRAARWHWTAPPRQMPARRYGPRFQW